MILWIAEVSHFTWNILPPQITYNISDNILAENQIYELFREWRQPLILLNYVTAKRFLLL